MTRRRAAPATARTRRPSAKLKSERIQGGTEKVPAGKPWPAGPGLERTERAGITRLLAQMPGWRFDEERSSFHVRIPSGPPVEIPAGDGLTLATGFVAWADVRLSGSARQWTKTRLEEVRAIHRRFAPAAVKAQPRETR